MVYASATIVKPIFSQLKMDARIIPRFEEPMAEFLDELEQNWREMDEIHKRLELLVQGNSLSKNDELDLQNTENQANELYVKILRKKIDFERHWKPSILDISDSNIETESQLIFFKKNFLERITYIIEEDMIPISEGLRVALRARGEWIKARKTEKMDKTLHFMNVILALVIYSEILIGMAQIYSQYQNYLVELSFLAPIALAYYYYRKMKTMNLS